MTAEPAALSIGAVLGDADAENMAWKRAINALSRQVQSLRSGVDSPLRLNVVYHVDGRLVPNEFTGVRTGRFDNTTNHLMVQAAVPGSDGEDRDGVILGLLHAAVDEAEEFARREGVADGLPELRALVNSLS